MLREEFKLEGHSHLVFRIESRSLRLHVKESGLIDDVPKQLEIRFGRPGADRDRPQGLASVARRDGRVRVELQQLHHDFPTTNRVMTTALSRRAPTH